MVAVSREEVAQLAYASGFTSSPFGETQKDKKILNSLMESFDNLNSNRLLLGDESEKRNVAYLMNRASRASPSEKDLFIKEIRDSYLGLNLFQ